jgi:hypothetical protein
MVLVLLVVWGMLRLMRVVRRRWLWRQSGVVNASRWVVPRRVNILSFVIILGGIALGLGLRFLGWADDAFVLRLFWAATGWGFGYTLYAMGRHLDLPRYRSLGLIGGLGSFSALFLPLGFAQTALVFGLLWGVLLGISGVIALRGASAAVREAG